ncbi:MAG TPA: hypothetical protein VNI83_06815 [Vicinamibacterales bacterium]|nr:hypothetical protein [Vicinamibacterales bacterium]
MTHARAGPYSLWRFPRITDERLNARRPADPAGSCSAARMINYTDRLRLLMRDIAARVPRLSFIDVDELFVFARFGRAGAGGAFATCHSLVLPTSEPAYYFWRDRRTGLITRRSEWFVTRTPEVVVNGRRVKYLISFVLPRFCDQTLERSRKAALYPPGTAPWIAKLDTVVHELYHVDPDDLGLRRFTNADGTSSARSHGPGFYEHVAAMVREYLASRPDEETYGFLRYRFAELRQRFGPIVGATFRNFPSFPQRYAEPLAVQPDDEPLEAPVEPLPRPVQPARYTDADIQLREFLRCATRRLDGSDTARPDGSRTRRGGRPAGRGSGTGLQLPA